MGAPPPLRTRPSAPRRVRGPRGGSPNACSWRSSVTPSLDSRSQMSLDGAARSRPVLHDVATRQVDEVSVPVMLAPPAHRIGTGFALLRPAAIVVAHLELRQFKRLRAAFPVLACRHVVIGNTHHETEATCVGIGEYRSMHRQPVIGIQPAVDRHMPGKLLTGHVDTDLTLVHAALP